MQLNFKEPWEWNVATPGLIYSNVRELYEQAPELQPQVGASLTPSPEGGGATFSLNSAQGRVLFKNAAFDEFMFASPQLLAVGVRSRYPGWPAIRARLVEVIGRLPAPPSLRGVSIRYINRMEFGAKVMNTDDYFTIPVHTAQGGKAPFSSFIYRTECPLEEGDIVRTTFATVVPQQRTIAFVLDLELIHEEPELSVEQALLLADHLKTIQNEEFENSITDLMRARFEDGFVDDES